MQRFFPARLPAAAARRDAPRARAATDGPVRIAFCDQEERAALRLFLRALRRLPEELDWEATVFSPTGAAPDRRARSRCATACTSSPPRTTSEDAVLAARRRRGRRLARAGARARPARARARRRRGAGGRAPAAPTRRSSRDGDLGLLFEPGDVDVLAAPARARWSRDDGAARAAAPSAARGARRARWARVADEARGDLRRGSPRAATTRTAASPRSRARLAERKLIDVDLHMHTDHSQRLRDAGRGAARHRPRRAGSARSRSPTTTRSPARTTRAPRPPSTASR